MEFDPQSIVGLNQKQAEKILIRHQVESRVACIDGKHFMLTQDFHPLRVNLTITNEIVVSVRME